MASNSQLRDDAYRQLWAEVVLMAATDLSDEPIDSVDYNQSVAFFVGGGPWAAWRAEVAGMLDLHADDLMRYGRRIMMTRIAARQAVATQPAKLVVVAPKPAPVAAVRPLVVPDCILQLRAAQVRRALVQRRFAASR